MITTKRSVLAITTVAAFATACVPETPTTPTTTAPTTAAPTTTVPEPSRIHITDNAHLDVLSVDVHGNHMHLGIAHADFEEALDPSDVIFELGHGNETTIGSQAGFSVLGTAGDELWTLDGGWSVHGAASGLFTSNTVTINIIDIEGPGTVGVWRFDGAGQPAFDFLSSNALPQTLNINHNAHAHRNWSFTEAGDYTITAEVTATLQATGQTITTGVETYSFEVGEGEGGGHDH